jgi:hypothetical protein
VRGEGLSQLQCAEGRPAVVATSDATEGTEHGPPKLTRRTAAPLPTLGQRELRRARVERSIHPMMRDHAASVIAESAPAEEADGGRQAPRADE